MYLSHLTEYQSSKEGKPLQGMIFPQNNPWSRAALAPAPSPRSHTASSPQAPGHKRNFVWNAEAFCGDLGTNEAVPGGSAPPTPQTPQQLSGATAAAPSAAKKKSRFLGDDNIGAEQKRGKKIGWKTRLETSGGFMVKLSLRKPCFNPKLAKVRPKEKGLCCEHDLVLALSEAGWFLWKTTARLGKGKNQLMQ